MVVETPSDLAREAPIDEAYFVWLYGHVAPVENKNINNTYWQLCKLLHTAPFKWKHERDENRAKDGIDQRHEFLRETGRRADRSWLKEPCSVFEMMIALAWKLEFDSINGESQSYWFWEMIGNLGLDEYTDANPPPMRKVETVIGIFLHRRYDPDGTGGLFPLQHADRDQREVELAYQGEAYLLEHS